MLDNWTKPRLTGVIMGSEFTLTTICIVTKCDKHIGYLPSVDCFEQGQARVEVVCSYQVDIYCQQNSTLLKDLKNLNSHVWSCILIVFNSSTNKPRWVFLKRNCVLLFLTYPYMLPSLNSTILIGEGASPTSPSPAVPGVQWTSVLFAEPDRCGIRIHRNRLNSSEPQGLLLATFWCCKWHMFLYIYWLVVSTPLKNMKVNGKDYPIYYGK